MILENLNIINYRNIAQAELSFSPKVNCFVGANGMGKTNVLDAIYYLSFCKSALSAQDAPNIRHGEEFFMLQGDYKDDEGVCLKVHCGVKAGQRKRIKRDEKEVKRVTEHIGQIPLVLISPADSMLITGGSEERRRFMDMVISQNDIPYLEAVMRYNKALQQRNALLKQEAEPDASVMDVLEEMMSLDAELIYNRRKAFVEEFVPIFSEIYSELCNNSCEQPGVDYVSHGARGPLAPQLREWRVKERIVGYSLHGVHKDDLNLTFNGYALKREGSQGQSKTYFIAMKLAQYVFLRRKGHQRTPLLLLDDIFDKLDAGRVERIVSYVSGTEFGQLFITDTNREHTSRILAEAGHDYRLFTLQSGEILLSAKPNQISGHEKESV